MNLKIMPKIEPRYWVAILIASACGTNLGDVIPEVLKISMGMGLLTLCLLFFVIIFVDKFIADGSEYLYWLTILVVRAAATNVADIVMRHQGHDYIEATGLFFVGMAILLIARRDKDASKTTGKMMPSDSWYWATMLTAGALGTVVGDSLAHSFGPVNIGIFISIGFATLALSLILAARTKSAWRNYLSYWIAVVAVRWWGTNVGDVLGYLGTRVGSMTATGLILLFVLRSWRTSHGQTYS